MKLIAPSILSADFSILGQELKAVEEAGVDWIHIDVMDGHFVPNLTYGPIIVEACKRSSSLDLDVHLMIENPNLLIPDFITAGADLISVHAEACVHLNRTIALIREKGARAGVAVNPATPLSCLDWVLEELEFVLIMSVNPGFGGQQFIPNSLERARTLKRTIADRGLDTRIQIDGGVNKDTIAEISRAGVDVFVAGSGIFNTDSYTDTVKAFRSLM